MRAGENGSGGSLSGNKKDVYIFLKIMKLMFGVSLTSFYLKYAIDRALGKGFTFNDLSFWPINCENFILCESNLS